MASETLRAVAESNLKAAFKSVWAYPAAGDALDMLDLLEPGEARAFYDTLTAGLGYGRARYEPSTRPCAACGTWKCRACGKKRYRALLSARQVCRRCGSRDGDFYPIRHRAETWAKHNPGRSWLEEGP